MKLPSPADCMQSLRALVLRRSPRRWVPVVWVAIVTFAGSSYDVMAQPPADGATESALPDSTEAKKGEIETDRTSASTAPSDNNLTTSPQEKQLRFSFQYAPWRDVLDWLSRESGLALSLESPPSGTFNYTDSRSYTTGEAIDVVNSLLLTKGYTLVRRDKMMLLVNLDDGIPPNLVTQVTPDELDRLGKYELVSCLFQLERLTPEAAQDELGKLLGPQGSMIVLPTSRQVIVTETAGKLRTIRRILQRVENPTEADGTKITPLPLQHVTPDEALAVIRQLMNIPEEEYATEDGSIRLSVDAMGTRLLAKASPKDIAELRDILSLVDVPSDFAVETTIAEAPQLMTYPINGANPETAMQVLQTLLAGMPDVRMSLDPLTDNLVALARPAQHATIRATLEQLAAEYDQIEIFPLQVVDPTTARLAVESLFGIKPGEEKADDGSAPRVDVDLTSKQLLVRGHPGDIERIRDLLDKMGEGRADEYANDRGNIRMLPVYQGRSEELLKRLEAIWPTIRKNRIRTVTPSAAVGAMHRRGLRSPKSSSDATMDEADDRADEADREPGTKPDAQPTPPTRRTGIGQSESRTEYWLAQATRPRWEDDRDGSLVPDEDADETFELPEIIIAPGPGGLLIASDDIEALDELESLLNALSDPALFQSNEYTVCYLRYAKADEAAALLNTLITGKSGADEGDAGGGMLGGLADMALGGMGNLFSSAAESMSFGEAVQIIPDARMNALFVKATSADVDLVRQLLEIIDQPHSPEAVETTPAPRLIPVFNTSASEIATVVREIYANRLATAGGNEAAKKERQPNVQEIVQAMRGGRGKAGSGDANGSMTKEPPLTIGVDARSNSLVVSAPEPLFSQIEALVAKLDEVAIQANETTRVVAVSRANPETIQSALNSLFGAQVQANTDGRSPGGNNSNNSANSAGRKNAMSASDQEAAKQAQEQMRRRIQFFNNLRRQQESQRGGRGGSGGGRGRPSGR